MSEPPVVLLPAAEIRRAVRLARAIAGAKSSDGRRDRFAVRGDHVQLDIEAFCAELAVARYLGLPWNGDLLERPKMRRAKPADVGDDVEVRTWGGAGRYFPVRDGDPPDRRIVVVGGRQPAYLILGWIRAGDAMRPAWRFDDRRRSAYWRVPQSELRPLQPA
jgi:hypothetical protein